MHFLPGVRWSMLTFLKASTDEDFECKVFIWEGDSRKHE